VKHIHVAIVVALVLPLAGCGSFYAEAEQPQVCLTVLPQTFTIPGGGVVAPAGGFQGTFTGQVDLGISDALPDFLYDGDPRNHVFRFLGLQASIAPTSGAANFDWLEGLSVTAFNGVTTTQLAVYEGGLPPGSRVLKVNPLDANNNLVTFIRDGSMVVNLEGVVNVPGGATVPATWSATVQGCFYAKVKKTFDELINGN